MNIKLLRQEIRKYCREKKILGSFNGVSDKWLVSFEIKKREIKTHCRECGKELTQSHSKAKKTSEVKE